MKQADFQAICLYQLNGSIQQFNTHNIALLLGISCPRYSTYKFSIKIWIKTFSLNGTQSYFIT